MSDADDAVREFADKQAMAYIQRVLEGESPETVLQEAAGGLGKKVARTLDSIIQELKNLQGRFSNLSKGFSSKLDKVGDSRTRKFIENQANYLHDKVYGMHELVGALEDELRDLS